MKVKTLEISWHNKEPVLGVHFSKERLATAGADNDIKLWSTKNVNQNSNNLEFLASLSYHSKAVNAVRFSPDGNMVASASDDGQIIIWKQAEAVVGAPSSSKITEVSSKSEDPNQQPVLENVENWTVHHLLRKHMGDVYDVCWSVCGSYLLSASIDNMIILWDAKKGRFLQMIQDHKHYVQGVAWDPLNQFVGSQACDRNVFLYKIKESTANGIALKSRITASYKTITLQDEALPVKKRIYADENLLSFYRRLEFSVDGNLLFAPAGILDANSMESNKDSIKSVHCVYGYGRNDFSRPILCFSNLNKPAVAIRCCPKVFYPSSNPEKDSGNNNDNNDENDDNPSTATDRASSLIVDLPYRIVIAVITLDSVLLYDTQRMVPFAVIKNHHYASLTDASWTNDGRALLISSRDGYCSIVNFSPGELGKVYELPNIFNNDQSKYKQQQSTNNLDPSVAAAAIESGIINHTTGCAATLSKLTTPSRKRRIIPTSLTTTPITTPNSKREATTTNNEGGGVVVVVRSNEHNNLNIDWKPNNDNTTTPLKGKAKITLNTSGATKVLLMQDKVRSENENNDNPSTTTNTTATATTVIKQQGSSATDSNVPIISFEKKSASNGNGPIISFEKKRPRNGNGPIISFEKKSPSPSNDENSNRNILNNATTGVVSSKDTKRMVLPTTFLLPPPTKGNNNNNNGNIQEAQKNDMDTIDDTNSCKKRKINPILVPK